jgi:hypothetical protein
MATRNGLEINGLAAMDVSLRHTPRKIGGRALGHARPGVNGILSDKR